MSRESINLQFSDEVDRPYEKVLFSANAISNATVTSMLSIRGARSATIERNDRKGRKLQDTWNLTDAECAAITTELNTNLRMNCSVTGGSIKKWYQPSQMHTDGPGATYSCIIPLEFEMNTDDWELKADGVYYNKSDIIVTVGNTSITNTVTLPAQTPHFGPGLVITNSEAIDKTTGRMYLASHNATSLSGGLPTSNTVIGTATNVANNELFAIRTHLGEGTGPTRYQHLQECIHIPFHIRTRLDHYKRSPYPWKLGAAILFKPEMLHCSTSWGGNGSLRTPWGFQNKFAYVIPGDDSSGYTTRYPGMASAINSFKGARSNLPFGGNLYKGYHQWEPGITKTHLLLNIKVNSE
jgi:hypothetical protein